MNNDWDNEFEEYIIYILKFFYIFSTETTHNVNSFVLIIQALKISKHIYRTFIAYYFRFQYTFFNQPEHSNNTWANE